MLEQYQGRSFKKLRLSLTTACNYHCEYCDPDPHLPTEVYQGLNSDQINQLLAHLNHLGIESLRLTGGEPLLSPLLKPLLRSDAFKKLPLIKAMTTNAQLLLGYLEDLKLAGVTKLNISLDTVEPDLYYKMTGQVIDPVLRAIDLAIDQGFRIKINCVVMQSHNAQHLQGLVGYAHDRGLEVRFLELMKMGKYHQQALWQKEFTSEQQIKTSLKVRKLKLIPGAKDDTARVYQWFNGEQLQGKLGFISNQSHPFCQHCSRLRMNHEGSISGCISKPFQHSLAKVLDLPLQEQRQAIAKQLGIALGEKQQKFSGQAIPMRLIGG